MKRHIFMWMSALLALFAAIGIGFSAFYFFPHDTSSSMDVVKKLDDIEENYDIAGVSDESFYYDVYFFVQEQAAIADDPLNYNVQANKEYGYWKTLEDEDLSGITIQPPKSQSDNVSYKDFGYRKITVYRSLSVEDFTKIGRPMTTAVDASGFFESNWKFGFSGWTADKQVAQNCINHRQGNFEYIDAFSALSLIDNKSNGSGLSIDGSQIGDHVIYLYPIFSTGKDKNYAGDDKQSVVEIVDSSIYGDISNSSDGEYFFSRENDGNEATFVYKNLNVTQNNIDNNNLTIKISNMMFTRDGIFGLGQINGVTWASGGGTANDWFVAESKDENGKAKKLFEVPGTYNIYAKVFYKTYYYDKSHLDNDQSFEELNDYVENKLTLEDFENSIQGVITNSFSVTNNENRQNNHILFISYIIVERVYEFHLLGSPYSTFDYNDPNVNRIYPATIYKNQSEDTFVNTNSSANEGGNTNGDSTTTSSFSKTYSLSNVYINPNNPGITSNHPEAVGAFPSSLLTVGASNRLWNFLFVSMSTEELGSLAEGSGFQTLGGDYLSSAENGDIPGIGFGEEEAKVNKPEGTYFLKIKEAGVYDFRFEVVFDKNSYIKRNVIDPDDPSKNIVEITDYVKIKVAIRKQVKDCFVKVFTQNVFEESDGNQNSKYYYYLSFKDNGEPLRTLSKPEEGRSARFLFHYTYNENNPGNAGDEGLNVFNPDMFNDKENPSNLQDAKTLAVSLQEYLVFNNNFNIGDVLILRKGEVDGQWKICVKNSDTGTVDDGKSFSTNYTKDFVLKDELTGKVLLDSRNIGEDSSDELVIDRSYVLYVEAPTSAD